MKYPQILDSHYSYLNANLEEATQDHEMAEDGLFVVSGPGKYGGLPLTFLYFWMLTMGGEGETYEDELGYAHYQFEIKPEEAKHIPGCVDLIKFHDSGNIIDMWEDDNGFLHYQFRDEMYKDPNARVCIRVNVFLTLPREGLDPENVRAEDYVNIELKEHLDDSTIDLQFETEESEEV